VLLDREPFELVISELGLGTGMNGWELADLIRERHPKVRVIIASGWGAGTSPEEAAAHGVEGVLA
jgi:DNA-binding NarL/FixJ family response regulator